VEPNHPRIARIGFDCEDYGLVATLFGAEVERVADHDREPFTRDARQEDEPSIHRDDVVDDEEWFHCLSR
jgi:hypothetical protein